MLGGRDEGWSGPTTIAVLGVDLGKNSCSLIGLDAGGRVVLRRRIRRGTVIAFGAKLPNCVVAMAACCGAHHMGRALVAQGHTIRLMSPEYVRPYVKSHENDDRDAEAIAEAATRPTMRFGALQSEAQRDVQPLHRVRNQLVGERTALTNQIRSILLEHRHVIPQGQAKLAACLTDLLDTDAGSALTPRMRILVTEVRERWQFLDQRIAAHDAEFAEQARTNEDARRLTTIPCIGALNATALVAAISDVTSFARGRDLAAWLGLVPRQVTTGGKPRLVGITKRGSKDLSKTLIQSARAAMPTLRQGDTQLGQWLSRLPARSNANTMVVALAAKMARIVWALLRHGRIYEATAVAA